MLYRKEKGRINAMIDSIVNRDVVSAEKLVFETNDYAPRWVTLKTLSKYRRFNVPLDRLRPQPTRRTSWKLVGNPGFQLVGLVGCGLWDDIFTVNTKQRRE